MAGIDLRGSSSSGNAASAAGLPTNFTTVTAAGTDTAGDFARTTLASASYARTLPANPAAGALIAYQRRDTNASFTLTVNPAGGGTINGDTSLTIAAAPSAGQWPIVILEHEGSNVWSAYPHVWSGPAGPTGATGATGPAGATGATGATGPAGSSAANSQPAGGGYFYATPIYGSAGTGSNPAGWMTACPIQFGAAVSITSMSINVTTAVASSTVRFGLYADSGRGTPAFGVAPLFDSGAGAVDTSTTGNKTFTLPTPYAFAGGVIWAVAVMQGGASNLGYTTLTNFWQGPPSGFRTLTQALTGGGSAWTLSGVTGALPTVPEANWTSAAQNVFRIVLTVS